MFEIPAALLAWFYGVTGNYAIAIALIAVVVMLIITPLTLKSTKGMLEMQRLAPEMRRLQQQYRGDRQKLNEEMMKLYQEHKVNPMSSCLPLLAQMPVFIIMFRVLHGLTYKPTGASAVIANGVLAAARISRPTSRSGSSPATSPTTPRCSSRCSATFEMKSFGIDLAISPGRGVEQGVQHRADLRPARRDPRRPVLPAAADGRRPRRGEPDDVPDPAEADAVPAGRLRLLPDLLPHRTGRSTTGPRRCCGSGSRPTSPGGSTGTRRRSAGRRSEPGSRPGSWPSRTVAAAGLFAQAKRDLAGAKGGEGADGAPARTARGRRRGDARAAVRATSRTGGGSKRTTAPKNRPTPSGKGASGRPRSSPPSGRPGGSRAKSGEQAAEMSRPCRRPVARNGTE